MDTATHIITVLTPDRPGIVHALARTLTEAGVHHLAISQTVVHGAFTIALVLAVPDTVDAGRLSDALARAAGSEASASLLALPVDASQHRTAAPPSRDRYVLTALGRAHSGIVGELARIVLEHGGNFTDFSSDGVDGALQLIAELELGPDGSLAGLQAALADAAASADARQELTVRLQHQRLFAATNEVAFRRSAS